MVRAIGTYLRGQLYHLEHEQDLAVADYTEAIRHRARDPRPYLYGPLIMTN